MKKIKFLALILLGCMFLLSTYYYPVLAAERVVKLTVPGCV